MKDSYKIPDSLDKSYADMEITLRSDTSNVGIKPLPLKIIMAVAASAVLYVATVTHGFMKSANVVEDILLALIWAAITAILCKRDDAGVMFIQYLKFFPSYVSNLNIPTKRKSNALPFYHLVGIDRIDPDGLIHYNDKSMGRLYSVTGNASVLLFENDQRAIIDAVDHFYRKLKPNIRLSTITVKAPQNIKKQLNAMKAIRPMDAQLERMRQMELHTLSETVGQEYKSIRQYILIRGNNMETFHVGQSVFTSEVENSSYVFSNVVQLNSESTCAVLKQIYSGDR